MAMPHGKNTFIVFVHTQTHEIHNDTDIKLHSLSGLSPTSRELLMKNQRKRRKKYRETQ